MPKHVWEPFPVPSTEWDSIVCRTRGSSWHSFWAVRDCRHLCHYASGLMSCSSTAHQATARNVTEELDRQAVLQPRSLHSSWQIWRGTPRTLPEERRIWKCHRALSPTHPWVLDQAETSWGSRLAHAVSPCLDSNSRRVQTISWRIRPAPEGLWVSYSVLLRPAIADWSAASMDLESGRREALDIWGQANAGSVFWWSRKDCFRRKFARAHARRPSRVCVETKSYPVIV